MRQMGNRFRTATGFAVGIAVGLGMGASVYVLVSSLPAPQMRAVFWTDEQSVEEAARNADWDPNAPLRLKPLDPAVLERATAVMRGGDGRASAGVSQRIDDLERVTAAEGVAADLPVDSAPRTRSFVGLEVVETPVTTDLDKLRRLRTRLHERGVEARIVRSSTDGTYSLRIGPFGSDAEMAEARQKLRDVSL